MGFARRFAPLVVFFALAGSSAFAQDAETEAEAAKRDAELWELQESTRKQYAELEKKLRTLAYVLHRAQPKLAARLRRALVRSEQGEILDVMERARSLLKIDDSRGASVSQNEAIEALEGVLLALETDDAEAEHLDPRRLEKLLKKLQALKERQERHLEDTERAEELEAKAKTLEEAAAQIDALLQKQREVVDAVNDAEAAGLPALARGQADVAEATEAVRKALAGGANGTPGAGEPGEGGPSEDTPDEQPDATQQAFGQSAKALGKAEAAMQEAKGKLKKTERDPALERARAASEALKEAKAALERKRMEILRLAAEERRRAEQEQTRAETRELDKDMQGGEGGQGGKSGESGQGGKSGKSDSKRAPGKRNIERAEEAMKRAGDNMANRHKSAEDVKQEQQQAMDELEQAEEILEEALQQARKREQQAILKALGQRFVAMLAEQKGYTLRTIKLLDVKTIRRRERQELKKLSRGEKGLGGQAREALELVREEGSTSILPIVLDELVRDFGQVAGLLADAKVNRFTIKVQQDLERSLEELIEVIKKEIEEREGGGGGGGGGGGPNENGDPLLPPTAELKVIKAQQERVNSLTKAFDLERTAEADLNDVQRQACDHISDKQGRVAEFTRTLHERLNKER